MVIDMFSRTGEMSVQSGVADYFGTITPAVGSRPGLTGVLAHTTATRVGIPHSAPHAFCGLVKWLPLIA